MPCRRLTATLLALFATAAVAGAKDLGIGVVAPENGPLAILGQQVTQGATHQAEALGDTVLPVKDSCAAGDGDRIADALIAAKAEIAIGFLCRETLEEALPKLKDAGIPAITIGVRADGLMEDAVKAGWPLFRLAPSQKAEIDRLAEEISTAWSAEPFALIDDGAIGNHDLTENLRAALEAKGVKPVLADTLRPGQDQQLTLVRHLTSAGVLRAFIAADRDDFAVLAKDLMEAAQPITLLSGSGIETTPGDVPLVAGVQTLIVKNAATDPANQGLVEALRAKGVEPEGYVMPAIAAMQVADAALSAAADEGKPATETLLSRAFETVLGPVRFTESHELGENPFAIGQWDGKAFVPPPKPQ